jgi:hypothetical protein
MKKNGGSNIDGVETAVGHGLVRTPERLDS